MPMTISASTRNVRASATLTYFAFGSGLNIHSKWFCRANQVARAVVAMISTIAPRRHHRFVPRHTAAALARTMARATAVAHGAARLNAYDHATPLDVCGRNGWIVSAGMRTIVAAHAAVTRRTSQGRRFTARLY